MEKTIYVNVKPGLRKFFCRHEWSDPQIVEGKLVPNLVFRVCLKCGKRIDVIEVRQKVRVQPR